MGNFLKFLKALASGLVGVVSATLITIILGSIYVALEFGRQAWAHAIQNIYGGKEIKYDPFLTMLSDTIKKGIANLWEKWGIEGYKKSTDLFRKVAETTTEKLGWGNATKNPTSEENLIIKEGKKAVATDIAKKIEKAVKEVRVPPSKTSFKEKVTKTLSKHILGKATLEEEFTKIILSEYYGSSNAAKPTTLEEEFAKAMSKYPAISKTTLEEEFAKAMSKYPAPTNTANPSANKTVEANFNAALEKNLKSNPRPSNTCKKPQMAKPLAQRGQTIQVS